MVVWETADEVQWNPVTRDAFGSQSAFYNSGAMAVFKDRLYIGSWGRGEVFRSSLPTK